MPLATEVNYDLVTLNRVKDWLSIPKTNTDADGILQFMISSFGQYVVNRTGVACFTAVNNYVEFYDGNGHTRMYLDNRPIVTLNSLTIGSFSPPQSTSAVTPGVYIERGGSSIAFRTSTGTAYFPAGVYPYCFLCGQGNIMIDYDAGYTEVPFDLANAAMRAISIYYQRKDWMDTMSKTLSTSNGSGTIRYRDWNLPPDITDVIDFYSRYARP